MEGREEARTVEAQLHKRVMLKLTLHRLSKHSQVTQPDTASISWLCC